MRKDIRIVHCGIEQVANGESAKAGTASELINMREREQALEVVGEPQAMAQLMPGDKVLLVDDDRTLVLRGNMLMWQGDVVLSAPCAVLAAHRVGRLLVVVTEQGNEVLLRTATGYSKLDVADAIPNLHIAAVESTRQLVAVAGYEFDVPYSTWQAPLAAADVDGLTKVVRNAYDTMRRAVAQQGRYAGVIMARYGVRLWDDSYLWLSQPVMVGHSLVGTTHRATGEVYTTGGKYAGVGAFNLEMESYRLGITMTGGVVEQWRDLVKAVDVLVSPQAIVIDATSLDYRCVVSTSTGTRRYLLEVGPRPRSVSAIVQQVMAGKWQVVASTTVLDGSGFKGANTVMSSQQVLPGEHCYAVAAHLQSVASVGTWHSLATLQRDCCVKAVGGVSMEHNGRLYQAPQSLSTSCQCGVLPWLDGGVGAGQVPALVRVTFSTASGEAVITASTTCSHSAASLNPLITFPDPRATHIAIAVGGRKWEMDLSPLDGMAVYLNPSLASNSMVSGAVDSGAADALVEAASGTLVVSAVNNALVGQWQATVSGHSIMGLGAACRPIYSGGFGRYPIYLFTHDGIMALPQLASGIYGEPRLISQEVLASGAKPVMAGDVVWFVSRQGVLCSLSGSLVKMMLHGIDGDARLSWNGKERELWIAGSGGDVRVLMPSGRTYRRSLQVGSLYSDARHALAVDSRGALLNLSEEQNTMMTVSYQSHPVEVDAMMRATLRRVTWNVFTTSTSSGMTPQGELELTLRGERGSSCHGFIISRVRTTGVIAAPLSRPLLAHRFRTLRLAISATISSGTLVLPTHIACVKSPGGA